MEGLRRPYFHWDTCKQLDFNMLYKVIREDEASDNSKEKSTVLALVARRSFGMGVLLNVH